MVATSPEHMPETRQEVRNGREPQVPAPAWDNSPPSGRSAAVAYLLWEQVVAGSIPAAPTKPSRGSSARLLRGDSSRRDQGWARHGVRSPEPGPPPQFRLP